MIPFTLVKNQLIYAGKIVRLETLRLRTPGGKEIFRELIRHPGAAVIVPRMSDGRFVLVRQHRIATDGWILEFPAGTLEPHENPKQCARRELIEETGYRAGRLRKLVDFYPAPGISTEHMHLYLATDLKPASGKLDDDEFLRVEILTERELERGIKTGKIKDGKTIIGYLYYARYFEKISSG